mgnify:CR=1 FL=1|tara:strand:+ start:400 stop:861 length:462 start_codon:yes stop_codon:yes gene_type:complete
MIYQLKREQILQSNIDDVWYFISSPKNLSRITPNYMNFNITSKDLPEEMYPGMLISYTVSPILGISISWLTEITQVQKKHFFIDEQRDGPYSMWHHQHFIEKHKDGVLMKDIVTYKLPLGFLGQFAHWLFIKKKLNNIFDYRFNQMEQIFNNK